MKYVFDKIISNPDVLGGKPCIAGTRISVEIILEWLATGASINDIVSKNDNLSKESVQQAIMYASKFSENEIIIEINDAA